MSKKFLLAFALTLVFSASSCGQKKGDEVKKKTDPITDGRKLTEEQLREACTKLGGRLADQNRMCLTRVITALPPFEPARPSYTITQAFYAGQYIVAYGTIGSGRVDILYDGSYLLGVPGRLLAPTGNGRPLTFFVNSAGYKDVSVAIWNCYDWNMNPVYCNDAVIP